MLDAYLREQPGLTERLLQQAYSSQHSESERSQPDLNTQRDEMIRELEAIIRNGDRER
jgi:hypothetical protein